MNDRYFSVEQQRFFARMAHWLPQLFERSRWGTAEARIGRRLLPDGREVELCLTCRTVRGGRGGFQYGEYNPESSALAQGSEEA